MKITNRNLMKIATNAVQGIIDLAKAMEEQQAELAQNMFDLHGRMSKIEDSQHPFVARYRENAFCWSCKHLNIYEGFHGTDITPAEAAELGCYKEHWNLMEGDESLKVCMLKALDCKDFELQEGLKK